MNLLKKHIQPVAAGALLPSPAACGADAAQDSGKEAVRFTVDLSVGEDGTVSLPGIQASLAVNSPHVQLTVTDVPSEDYRPPASAPWRGSAVRTIPAAASSHLRSQRHDGMTPYGKGPARRSAPGRSFAKGKEEKGLRKYQTENSRSEYVGKGQQSEAVRASSWSAAARASAMPGIRMSWQ